MGFRGADQFSFLQARLEYLSVLFWRDARAALEEVAESGGISKAKDIGDFAHAVSGAFQGQTGVLR